MKLFAAAAALTAGLLIAGAASASTNLVINGSFEDGISSWMHTGGSTDGYIGVVIDYNSATPYPTGAFGLAVPPDNTPSASPDPVGNHALYLVGDYSNEAFTQLITLHQGRYLIGFSAYTPANGLNNPGDGIFTASLAGWNVVASVANDLPASTWTYFSHPLTIGATTPTSAAFTFQTNYNPSNDIVVDRVFVIAVPEPASWALMILGFGGVGAALRSSRRRTFALA